MLNREILFALFAALNLGITFLNLPPGLGTLMDLYGVGYAGISVLLSALLWSHALLQVPAGLMADRLGVKRTLLTAFLLLVFGNGLPILAPLMGLAILGRVIAGIGTGLSFVTLMKLIALYAPQGKTGTLQGIFAGLFSFGNIAAYLLIPKFTAFGWQWIFLLPCFSSLLLLTLCFGLRSATASSDPRQLASLRLIVRHRAAWTLGFYHAISWGTIVTLGNWIPSLMAEVWAGSSPERLAWGGIAVMFLSGIGRIMGGFILFKIPPLAVANSSILLLALIFTGLFTVEGAALLLPLALLAAFFSCVNFGSIFHLASTVVPPGSLATLIGFVNFLANLGAVLFTLLFGFCKDATGTFAWAFGVMMVLAGVAVLLGQGILKKDCTGNACQAVGR